MDQWKSIKLPNLNQALGQNSGLLLSIKTHESEVITAVFRQSQRSQFSLAMESVTSLEPLARVRNNSNRDSYLMIELPDISKNVTWLRIEMARKISTIKG